MRAKEQKPGFSSVAPEWEGRARCIDWLLQLGRAFELSSFTVHIAVALLDRYLVQRPESDLPLVVVSCLNLADVYSEISKEYYKQDNAKEYADMKDEYPPSFGDANFNAAEIVAQEKLVLRTLGLDLHFPTVFWFTSAYLCVAGYEGDCPARLIAQFLADLVLLDAETQAVRASLVAQACVVLGVYLAQRAIPGVQDVEPLCDAALAQWLQVRGLVRSGEAKEDVDLQMCFQHLVKVLTVHRRAWKLEELQAVEQRHSPTALKLTYPSVWPAFLLKYLVRSR